MQNQNINISQVWDAIGRKNLQEKLGVTEKAISHCVSRNSIPSSWYFSVKELADEHGITIPKELFSFKGVDA